MPSHESPDQAVEARDDARLTQLVHLVAPWLRATFQPVVRGLERAPEGACLFVGNHSGGMLTADTWILCAELFARGGADAVPFGLGHDAVTRAPGLGALLRSVGGVPAGYENAKAVFDRGLRCLVYPGGDHEALRPFRERYHVDFGGRTGYVRLALRAGVPIVPVAAVGGHSTGLILFRADELGRRLGVDRLLRLKAFPVALSFPWGLTVGMLPPHLPLPTRIFVEVLEPIHVAGDPEDEALVARIDAEVRERLQVAVRRLAAERREAGRWPIPEAMRRVLGG